MLASDWFSLIGQHQFKNWSSLCIRTTAWNCVLENWGWGNLEKFESRKVSSVRGPRTGPSVQSGSLVPNDRWNRAVQGLSFDRSVWSVDPGIKDQMKGAFSKSNSPIWMDSSTKKQCQALTNHVGGAQNLSNITGSSSYERFSINQILKFSEG